MKKGVIVLLSFLHCFTSVSANYEQDLIDYFVNSPSLEEIKQIEDPVEQYCELVYFDAYMRREFSDFENLVCKETFVKKFEGELLYKKTMLTHRGIY